MVEMEEEEFRRVNPDRPWPQDVLDKLLNRMKLVMPEDDRSSYTKTLRNLRWEKVAFDDYAADDCRQMWNQLAKNIRKFRTMKDLVEEALTSLHEIRVDKRRKSKKAGIHPERPRKPLYARLLYFQAQKGQKHGDMSFKEWVAKINNDYKNLSDEERQKYEDLAKLEKEEYGRKLKMFLKKYPDEIYNVEKKKYGLSITDAIKFSAYKIYLDENVSEMTKSSETPLEELVKTAQTNWESLSLTDRLPWFTKAKEKEKEEKNLKRKLEKKLQKNKTSNLYSFFVHEMSNSGKLAHVPNSERMTLAAKIWKEMKEDEKAILREKHKESLNMNETVDSTEKKKKKSKAKEKVPREESDIRAPILNGTNVKEEIDIDEENEANSPVLMGGASRKKNAKRKDAPSVVKENTGSQEQEKETFATPKKKKKIDVTLNESEYSSPIFSSKVPKITNVLPMGLAMKKEPESPNKSPKKKTEWLPDPTIKKESAVMESPKKAKSKNKEISLESILERAPKAPTKEPIKLFKTEMKKQKIKFRSDEELQKAWDELPGGERKRYKKLHKANKSEYTARYEEFISSLSERELKLYTASQNLNV